MQFPLRLYYDPAHLEKERKLWFQRYGGFVGFTTDVPNLGDYRVIPHTNNSKILVNNDQGLSLLSNFCRHRQAQLLKGSGNLKGHRIVCPIHRWGYDLKGNLQAAHGFKPLPVLTLQEPELYNFNGVLTSEKVMHEAMQRIKQLQNFDATKYRFVSDSVVDYKINWKEYMDVYFDNYHVQTFHPGLRALVNVKELEWDFGDGYIVQKVGWNKNFYKHPGSPKWERYADELKAAYGEKKWDYGATWFSVFPNFIMEWMQDFMLTAIAIPVSPTQTQMHFGLYCHESIADNQPLINSFEDAVGETEEEDGIIMESVCNGRYQLWVTGHEDHGPYHHPTEIGMRYYHEYLLKNYGEPIIE